MNRAGRHYVRRREKARIHTGEVRRLQHRAVLPVTLRFLSRWDFDEGQK
jgi:hypothetical protein